MNALIKQNFPKNSYEIIVVDDGSIDDTKKIVEKTRGVKLIEQKHKGPAVARNLGVKKSKGDIILFTDSDCIPGKNWIKHMTKPFEDKDVVGVQGTYKTYNKDKKIARFAGYEIDDRHKKFKREIDFIATFSSAFRKKYFKKVGGFDETFQRASAEDTDLGFKLNELGFKIVFQPKGFVYTYHPENLKTFLRKKFWMGYWRVYLYKKHKNKLMKHSYTPKTVYLGIVLSWLSLLFILSSLLNSLPLHYSLYPLLVHIILNFNFSYEIFKKDKIVGLISPFIIILRDFISGLGIIYGLKNIFIKVD